MAWTPLRDHPSPLPPPINTPKTKRVPICSILNFASLLRPKFKMLQSYGAKIEMRTPMHTYPTRHPQLACGRPLHSPTMLSFLQNSTWYLMLALSWKFGVNCCSFGLTHSAACTQALVPLACGHVHRPPFYTICSKRVPIDWV